MAKIAIFAPEKEFSMVITNTTNSNETSVSVKRETGETIDFCHMENEIIIGETQAGSGDDHVQIALNMQEAYILKEKLIRVFS